MSRCNCREARRLFWRIVAAATHGPVRPQRQAGRARNRARALIPEGERSKGCAVGCKSARERQDIVRGFAKLQEGVTVAVTNPILHCRAVVKPGMGKPCAGP